ncbi:MAG TPA: WD40 repeat domain-containing protein, partial [Streptomyces sp.]|nr:WD40 repeat domain-containing protein [Streptomyces sp.]
LHQRGPLAAWADLHAIPTEAAAALADDLTRAAHLLTLTDPPALLTNVLHSRLGSLPHWQERITARQAAPAMRPLLRNHWPPPDLPDEGQIRTFLGHAGPVWSVAVSPDGASLTTIGPDGMARGLNPGKGGSLHVDVRGRGRFRALAAAPDGTWLATGGNGRRVHVWPVGRVTAARAVIGPVGNPVRGFTTAVQALAISPDGHRIAVATTEETIQAPDSNRLTPTAEGTVEVWDVRTERVVATTSDRQYRKVTRVAIAPDGTWLAVGGHDGVTLMSMDLRVKVETRGVSSGRPVTALAIAPNGSWVVSGEQDGTLQFWDEETLVAITRIAGHDGPVTAVAVAPDATWLASGGEDGTVRLWDLESEEPRARAVYVGHTGPVNSLTIAPDGGWLASAGVDGTVRIWKPGVPGQARDMSRSGWIDKVDVIAGGRWLVTVHRDGRVLLWNPETGRWIWVLRARPREEVGAVVVAQDGSWYATAHRPSRKVELWDRETGTRTARLDVTSDAMAIAPDGTWLAIADGNGAVQLWDRATGARTASLSGGNRRVTTVAIAPDGKWLAAVAHVGRAGERRDESTLKVFDVASGRCTQEIHCAQKLTGVAIAPDGRWLATSGADGVVSVWDPLTGELTASFTDPDGPVGSLAISPDGAWIATAGSMLRVWDRDAGRTVAAVRAETPLTSCAWMPDGRGLVAAGERGLHSYEFRP